MNWPVLLSLGGSFLAFAGLVLWRAASWHQRSLNEQERCREDIGELASQMQRQRDWKHDRAAPMLQVLWQDYEMRTQRGASAGPYRVAPLPSYQDLEDSRVTNDPKKEPKK